MAAFPILSTSAVTQYPSSRQLDASTFLITFVDGSRQAFRDRRISAQRWILRMDRISPAEAATLEDFWWANGPGESFAFTDPWNGTEYPECRFATESADAILRGDGHTQAVLIIESNQV